MCINQSPPFVSVIIPVFNDNARLKICLSALEDQTYPKLSYEVIVVDNNSDEDVSSVVEQFTQARLTHESHPGSYIARNRGISLAQGEVIAFTDADCIPSVSWLEKGVAALYSDSNVGLVAGRIELFVKNPEDPNPFELYESLVMSFPQDEFLRNARFGATANVLTFKKVLEDVGQFDETLKSGGDRDWGQRVFALGYQQIYAEDVLVKHPARNSWAALSKRAIRITGGRYDLLRKSCPSNVEALKDLILFLKPPFRSFYQIWTDHRLPNFKQKVQFTGVMLLLRYVTIRERLRLQLGGGVADRG